MDRLFHYLSDCQFPRSPYINTATLTCLLLGLNACASVMPPHVAPVALEVPIAWSITDVPASAARSSLAQWWLSFNDPLLSSLVARALQANTSVASAQAALLQARALRDVSAAALLPGLNGSASAGRNKSGGKDASNSFRLGLDASWEPDIFGANRSALAASEASAQATAASLGDVQISIAAEVALSYIALRGAQARLAIANDNLASQQETLQITRWREQAGLITTVETEQARAASEQTRAQLPALQTSIAQTGHALDVLIGQPPASLTVELATASQVPQAADDLTLRIPAETLRQRPDVRAAEHQVSAASARVAQADAARDPRFQISGSLGLQAMTLGALTHATSVIGALLAGVSVPIFDGGAGTAQMRAQQAVLSQAELAYQSTVLSALQEVEDALVALRGDRQRLQHLQRAAAAAGNAALLAQQRYRSGLVDFQTVLETERTQFNTQTNVAAARTDLGLDHVRLYKALGGGWQPDSNDITPGRLDYLSQTSQ